MAQLIARLTCWLYGHQPRNMWFDRDGYRVQRWGCARCKHELGITKVDL